MKKNIEKYFLFFVIFLIMKCKGEEFSENITFYPKNYQSKENNSQPKKPLWVAQTVMEQASYYNNSDTKSSINITHSFIDFYMFRFYYINMSKINPNIDKKKVTFRFYFEKLNSNKNNTLDAFISIKCTDGFRCNKFEPEEHQYVSFDFDLYITSTGGVISFLLILVGIFCLMNGYIYFNITTAFYSGYSIFLLLREICELMELNHSLNTNDTSYAISLTVYIFSIITSVAYGYISIKTKYLKYISFGFIIGLIFAKVLYFYIIVIFKPEGDNIFLGYFVIEILSCIGFIIFFFLFKNKNLKITIGTVSILASYGFLYGFHILLGGIPFLPFFILSKTKFEKYELEVHLFNNLKNGNKMHYYALAFVLIAIGGFYLNYSRYKLFIEKRKKNISTL